MASADTTTTKSYRAAPYPQNHARPSSSRHRTMVFNHTVSPAGPSSTQGPSSSPGWVTKRDRHVQLINNNILEQETQARSKAMAETRKQRALMKDQQEIQKIQKFLQSGGANSSRASMSAPHEINIDGLRFRVLKGGSKLARIRGAEVTSIAIDQNCLRNADNADSAISTPKRAQVGAVLFLRSKNGNLYRSGIVRAKRYRQPRS